MKSLLLLLPAALLFSVGAAYAMEPHRAVDPAELPGLASLQLDEAKAYKKFAKPRFSLMTRSGKTAPAPLPEASLLRTVAEITGFCVRAETPTSAYLAAGIDSLPELETDPDLGQLEQPELAGPALAYLVGAGFDCDLGEGARLNFGYRFLPDSVLDLGNPFAEGFGKARDDHNISIDLSVPF